MEVTVGQPVTFTATIKNTGGSSRQFGSGNGVLFIVDGVTKYNDQSYELTAGGEHQFSVTGGSDGSAAFTFNQAGTKTVTVRTEGGNGVNAEKSFTINVVDTAKPDMVITNLWWEPASPNAGDKVTFHATIKNQGTAATPSDQYTGVAFWINGQKLNLWTGSDGAIQPGQSVNVQADGGEITWTATQGSHSIRAMVDDAGRYTESNEDNNTWEGTINVAAASTPASLEVTALSPMEPVLTTCRVCL
jgi:subtilase family serine protease